MANLKPQKVPGVVGNLKPQNPSPKELKQFLIILEVLHFISPLIPTVNLTSSLNKNVERDHDLVNFVLQAFWRNHKGSGVYNFTLPSDQLYCTLRKEIFAEILISRI